MVVNVLQFKRPDGLESPQTVDVADDCQAGYEAMLSCGLRLTAEMVPIDVISICIEHPEHGDYDHKLIANGPEVITAIESMLLGFNSSAFHRWRREYEAVVEKW